MTAWVDPTNWDGGVNVVAELLNTGLRDNLLHLRERNMVVYTLPDTTNITTTSDTFVPVTETLQLVTTGQDVRVQLSCVAYNTIAGSRADFDVLVDDDWYVSSGTPTPMTDGLMKIRTAAAYPRLAQGSIILTGLDAGLHKFQWMWKRGVSGTATIWTSNTEAQITVEEYGSLGF